MLDTYTHDPFGMKLSRDEDSMEMIKLIFDTVQFDPLMNYFGGLDGTMQLFATCHNMLVKGGQNTFASWLATYSPPAEAYIENFNDAVLDIDS